MAKRARWFIVPLVTLAFRLRSGQRACRRTTSRSLPVETSAWESLRRLWLLATSMVIGSRMWQRRTSVPPTCRCSWATATGRFKRYAALLPAPAPFQSP